jgi:hypothetical protein
MVRGVGSEECALVRGCVSGGKRLRVEGLAIARVEIVLWEDSYGVEESSEKLTHGNWWELELYWDRGWWERDEESKKLILW